MSIKNTFNISFTTIMYSLWCFALILFIPVIFMSCSLFGGSDDEPYTGPTTMIDDFEDGDFDIIVQQGRRGHWVPFLFPHPNDGLVPDSAISTVIESPTSSPPSYSAEGLSITSTKALHVQGTIGNPSGILDGYVKLITDLATNANWTSSSDYSMTHRYLLFYRQAHFFIAGFGQLHLLSGKGGNLEGNAQN